jgi:hypothetical protein
MLFIVVARDLAFNCILLKLSIVFRFSFRVSVSVFAVFIVSLVVVHFVLVSFA